MSDNEEDEQNIQSKYDFSYSVKFIIVGDSSVGKSNILLRFSHNTFDPGHQATLGIEFANKHLIYNNTDYLIQIWTQLVKKILEVLLEVITKHQQWQW